jgi:redox-sensitive bicupin YhaK (pirin superfamily)
MKTTIHKSDSRGHADHGWLNAHHSFSFASWHNPEKVHFGMLRVLNDDIVQEGKGFGTHPHDNMEIITIPLKGSLQHKDSMGNTSIIKAGEVQVMSAGSGVSHSEFNPSETDPVNLFQIWIFPDKKDVEPRYDQKEFNSADRKNKFQTIISPKDKVIDGSMWIHQNAHLSLGNFDKSKVFNYDVRSKGNGVYVMVINGKIEVDGKTLGKRDAIGIEDTDKINFKSIEDSELLLIEVPMK